MNKDVLAYAGGIIRVITTLLGGFLAQKGIATNEETQGIVGAVVIAGTGFWSIWAKWKALKQVPPGAVMKSGSLLVLLALTMGLGSGCSMLASDKQTSSMVSLGKEYYLAPNVAELWVIENTNAGQVAEFTVKNFTRFAMNTPVPPKNIIPREPSFWEGAWDTVKTLGPWAFFYGAVQSGAMGGGTGSTVNNYTTASP